MHEEEKAVMRKRLKRISEHVWVFPMEPSKDRPNLGYVLGEKTALAVDAGHSSSHVADFYAALEAEELPLPSVTVITHWHWDHTFGMHAVNGKTIARTETSLQLLKLAGEMERDPARKERFLKSDPTIRREYADHVPVRVVPADEDIEKDTRIDLGGVTAQLLRTESPHTDDALLVHIPEDRILFIGDAQLGEFPSWRMDYERLSLLTQKIRGLEADLVIDGHGMPCRKKDFLAEYGY